MVRHGHKLSAFRMLTEKSVSVPSHIEIMHEVNELWRNTDRGVYFVYRIQCTAAWTQTRGKSFSESTEARAFRLVRTLVCIT
jgi:hypothetical protein